MRHKSVAIYAFSELSERGKERAKQRYAEAFGYTRGDDALASLKELAKHFGGRIVDYEIDYFGGSHSSARFDMPEMEREEIAERLAALGTFNPETLKGNGDCKLTGYCSDDDAIDGFRIAFHAGENDLSEMMDSAFDSWLKAAQADCEWQYADEQFSETADANNWEYTEDGEMA